MPLRDVSEYHAWVEREQPSDTAPSAARAFITELGDKPWRAPTIPIAELSNQPEYEIRVAALDVSDEPPVWVWYLHAYATTAIDLIAVTNT